MTGPASKKSPITEFGPRPWNTETIQGDVLSTSDTPSLIYQGHSLKNIRYICGASLNLILYMTGNQCS